jgi:hypothetical protein
MPLIKSANNNYIWQLQPSLALHLEPPTQNVWYTLIDESGGIRVRQVYLSYSTDEGDREYDIEFTIDGNVTTKHYFPTRQKEYGFIINVDGEIELQEGNISFGTENLTALGSFLEIKGLFECSSLQIRIRQTTIAYPTDELYFIISFDKKLNV